MGAAARVVAAAAFSIAGAGGLLVLVRAAESPLRHRPRVHAWK